MHRTLQKKVYLDVRCFQIQIVDLCYIRKNNALYFQILNFQSLIYIKMLFGHDAVLLIKIK